MQSGCAPQRHSLPESGSPRASGVGVDCTGYLQRARRSRAGRGRRVTGRSVASPGVGPDFVGNLRSASELGERVSGHLPARSPTPCFPWPRILPSRPTPHTAPPAGGARRAPGLRSRRFRCLFTVNCLCRKMLVTRAERFRPGLVDPAGGSSRIPPAKPRRSRRQGGGCVPPGARPPALLRTPGRGSTSGARPARVRAAPVRPAAGRNPDRGGLAPALPPSPAGRGGNAGPRLAPGSRLLHSEEARQDPSIFFRSKYSQGSL